MMAEKRTDIMHEKCFKSVSSVYTFEKNILNKRVKTLRAKINLEKWRDHVHRMSETKWPNGSRNYKLNCVETR
jgi:hypothetical protein